MRPPVVVTGMHRSGTSLVASLLDAMGLHLGDHSELVPPAPDNPAGFWEHGRITALDDRLLAELGGGWDAPPRPRPGWFREDRFGALRTAAADVVERLADRGAWGFKDPRAALLLDFWTEVAGPPQVVLCVRNPIEVARSLQARNGFSAPLALRLWWQYDDAIRRTLLADDRLPPPVVVHYRAILERPEAECIRLAGLLGLDPDLAAQAVERLDRGLRHHRFDGAALEPLGVDDRLVARYAARCDEAGFDDATPPTDPASTTAADLVGGDPSNAGASSIDGAPDPADDRLGRIDIDRLAHADLVARYHVRGGHLAILERRLAEAAARIADLEDRLASAPIEAPASPDATLTGGAGPLLERLEDLVLRFEAASGDERSMVADRDRRLRRLIEGVTVPGTRVGIVGGTVDPPAGRHLNELGVDLDVETLQVLGAEGVDVIAVAAGGDVAATRDRCTRLGYLLMVDDPDVGSLWRVVEPTPSFDDRLRDLCDAAELRTGRAASVLDLTEHGLGDAVADRAVLRPDAGDPDRLLPGTVDLVVVDPTPDRPFDEDGPIEHYRHPAASGATVIAVPARPVVVDHEPEGRIPTVSLAIAGASPRFVRSVIAARPEWWRGEMVTDVAPGLDGVGSVDVRWLGRPAGIGELVDASGGEIIVAVAGPWLPLAGWLAPLVDALTHAPDDRPVGLAVARTRRPDSPVPAEVAHGADRVVPWGPGWDVRRSDGPFGGHVVAVSRAAWADVAELAAPDPADDVVGRWAAVADAIADRWASVWVPESTWIGFGETEVAP